MTYPLFFPSSRESTLPSNRDYALKDALTLRRSQILLASAKGSQPREIATHLGCSVQTVRNTIRAFHQQGLACLQAQSSRPKTVKPIFDEDKRVQLRQLLHANPRQ